MPKARRKKNHLGNNRGVALMIALFALMLMLFIAVEVSYESNVEYVVAAQQVNRLKAYYAAKSGVELSLLRILIYKKVMATMGESMGEMKSMLDMIWAMPLSWPPIPPDGLSEVDKDQIQTAVKESVMEGQYLTTISAEGGAIDINDLGSPAESLRKSTRIQLTKALQQETENNEEFGDKFRGKNWDELINNIVDWIDEDQESLNGGDEHGGYEDFKSDYIPPNQPFKTMEELHMVKGMTDDIFKVLQNIVTVYGTKGVNVNYAPADMLKALDISMTDDIVKEVLNRRSNQEKGGLFKNADDFLNFIAGFGANRKAIEDTKIPILTDPEYNFRIRSTGQSSNVHREITVVTYDFETLKEKFIAILDKEEAERKAGDGGDKAPDPKDDDKKDAGAGDAGKADDKKTVKVPKGRPTIVFWDET